MVRGGPSPRDRRGAGDRVGLLGQSVLLGWVPGTGRRFPRSGVARA